MQSFKGKESQTERKGKEEKESGERKKEK